MTVYQEHGYKNRREYLESLADEYDIPVQTVFALASMLGESEDFDGLINALEDAAELMEFE
jgi:hypothetical protein